MAQTKITNEQLEAGLRRWAEALRDPAIFIERYCYLKDQRSGKAVPFFMWPAQKHQIKLWQANQRNITLKSRQIGITWLALAYALWHMVSRKYWEGLIVSRKEEAAISALEKLKFMYDHMPSLFKEQLIPIKTDNRLLLELGKVECKMKAESANPEAGRSDTLNMLILDEDAFMPDAHSIWTAAWPTLEKTGGPAILISTANGYDPHFQPTFAAGLDGNNGFKTNFISWQGDPNRDQEWYDRSLREAQYNGNDFEQKFRQEYPSNAEEAFIVTGNTVFSGTLVKEYLDKPLYKSRVGQFGVKNRFSVDALGPFTLFEHPNRHHKYAIGVDSAEGLEKGDFSVAVVYNRNTGEQVAEYRGHLDTDMFAKTLNSLGKWYNNAILNIEMNNMGDTVLNILHKHLHYPNIYRQMRYDSHSSKKVKKLGWKTTMSSKPLMIDTLNSLLRDHEMMPRSRKLFSEMKTFVRLDAGMSSRMGASGTNHDDCVIAHALAAIVLAEKPIIQSISANRPAVYQPLPRVSFSEARDRNNVLKSA